MGKQVPFLDAIDVKEARLSSPEGLAEPSPVDPDSVLGAIKAKYITKEDAPAPSAECPPTAEFMAAVDRLVKASRCVEPRTGLHDRAFEEFRDSLAAVEKYRGDKSARAKMKGE